MKKRFRLTILLAIVSLLVFQAVHISPEDQWYMGFLALTIPFFLICNAFFLYYWVRKRKFMRAIVPIMVFIFGWSQVSRGISFDSNEQLSEENKSLRVLSGNVRVFNVYDHLRKEDPQSSEKLIQWLENSNNEVLCLQEYYDEPGNPTYHTSKRFKRKFPHQKISATVQNRIGAKFGVAIFSKYKILNSDRVKFAEKSRNQAIYADLLWGKDTVRVYNIHLESMHISDEKIDRDELKKRGKDTYRRLRKGFATRARQIDKIQESIVNCKHPVIVCGDLNDLPYSYTYETLRTNLSNSFEDKGFGIGTTYNGNIPFLRIDNQFYSEQFSISSFNVHSDIDYSDHYPISATYTLEK